MIRGNTSDFVGHPLPKDSIYPIRTWGLPPLLGPGPPASISGAATDAVQMSELLVYVHFVGPFSSEEEMLFNTLLETTTKT